MAAQWSGNALLNIHSVVFILLLLLRLLYVLILSIAQRDNVSPESASKQNN